jgi:NitT/TauT family transport system permease protein
MKKRIPLFNFSLTYLIDEFEFTWRDFLALLMFISSLWIVIGLVKKMSVAYSPTQFQELDLSYNQIPYYMLRSTFRMFIAYAASLLFTTIFGYWAYRSKRARS